MQLAISLPGSASMNIELITSEFANKHLNRCAIGAQAYVCSFLNCLRIHNRTDDLEFCITNLGDVCSDLSMYICNGSSKSWRPNSWFFKFIVDWLLGTSWNNWNFGELIFTDMCWKTDESRNLGHLPPVSYLLECFQILLSNRNSKNEIFNVRLRQSSILQQKLCIPCPIHISDKIFWSNRFR